ncbi:MAG: transcription-repair coupling factor [Flavobacteriales bacterium]|nr:transcription-repair coupling factor [Flavobacteriales bacterium]
MFSTPEDILKRFIGSETLRKGTQRLDHAQSTLHVKGITGSAGAFVVAAIHSITSQKLVVIFPDKEEAAYFFNDLEVLLPGKSILFFPASFRRVYQTEETDNANIMLRTEVLEKISENRADIIVTYPSAISEKVVTREKIAEVTLTLKKGEAVDLDFITDLLIEYNFEREDFVYEAGQFALRGGIVDVFSYAEELPYRIEFDGDKVYSIRTFKPEDQLSVKEFNEAKIIPNLENKQAQETRQGFFEFISEDTILVLSEPDRLTALVEDVFHKAEKEFQSLSGQVKRSEPADLFLSAAAYNQEIKPFRKLIYGNYSGPADEYLHLSCEPQPVINKNFDLLYQLLESQAEKGCVNYILSDAEKQFERLSAIFDDLHKSQKTTEQDSFHQVFVPVLGSLQDGFICQELEIACFCDHRIFERYRRFKLKSQFTKDQAITLKELGSLQPGDYITHIDHGIGVFAGLEKTEVNGKIQEAVKLVYKDKDVLYVSIHSLHRIAKYTGKEGTAPSLHKLGGTAWAATKAKTKKRIRELAFDLIKLYAKRKAEKGFAYHPDTYLQHELEASFIYEDTPDQNKATRDVKTDMEKPWPMDRLVCGDVGFGKTEVAIRAAFKAATDGKQVAVLVPTTILALQHFKTFSSRLKEFPVTVDYINRFKSAKAQKETLEKLANGKVDIIIGTHRLVGKDVQFKDLGLLVVDEEQKFGVNVKDKLKTLKANVDSLTLTATPIPRTLQFSLMGARDLSIIRTPPPNRYPIVTELLTFNEEAIRDAVHYEISRNGQVFFIHNRVNDIKDIAGMVQRLVPQAKIRVAHGQMGGEELEEVMLEFIEGEFDVLVSTAIVEAGLDVPNANTIIINQAQNFGLSDLHQLRGRVGRSNKKAFCYLITPPLTVLTEEARKRMKAIVEFSELGSGFNISMRDLDIRGAGDLLGGEQSGFINDIGYETYQRILNETIAELKENEFAELFHEENNREGKEWTDDCVIDTDLEILIPADYVDNIPERLNLYKELDSLTSEEELDAFSQRLHDRFGKIPSQTEELIQTMHLRLIARRCGVEKMVFKKNTLILQFTSKADYYNSAVFSRVLQYLQTHKRGEMKQKNDRLQIVFKPVETVSECLGILSSIQKAELLHEEK